MTGDDPFDRRDIIDELDDDMPTVDVDDVPDGALDDVESVSVGGFDQPAEALVASFTDDVVEAVASAMWHTVIDGAAHESFVDDLSTDDLRDAVKRLRSAGYAEDGLTVRDIYGDESGDKTPEGAGFFMGVDAADDYDERVESMRRVGPTEGVGFGELPNFDGFVVERSHALPSHVVVFIDVDAIARVPAEGRMVDVGLNRTPSVSSPIVVRDPDGIAVVNIAED